MRKVLKYLIINYTEKDLDYIEVMIDKIESISQEIMNFFELKKIQNKIEVNLNSELDIFRKKYLETGYYLSDDNTVPKWICGFSFDNKIETLTLKEYQKTYNHKNANINDLCYLILHEFCHACYDLVSTCDDWYAWLNEGIATTISHQYDNKPLTFDITLEEAIYGCQDYNNFHTMFVIIYQKYGKEYILNLIKNYKLLETETPKLITETKKIVKEVS